MGLEVSFVSPEGESMSDLQAPRYDIGIYTQFNLLPTLFPSHKHNPICPCSRYYPHPQLLKDLIRLCHSRLVPSQTKSPRQDISSWREMRYSCITLSLSFNLKGLRVRYKSFRYLSKKALSLIQATGSGFQSSKISAAGPRTCPLIPFKLISWLKCGQLYLSVACNLFLVEDIIPSSKPCSRAVKSIRSGSNASIVFICLEVRRHLAE